MTPFDHRDLVVFDLDGTLIDSIGVWNEVDYKPGADVLVRRLSARGIRLAIASTTRRPNLEIYLSRNQNIRSKAPLDEFFDPILVRDDVREGKPSPEVYLRILEETGVPADRALAVEDSLPGVESARAAGIDVVAVHDRHSDPDRAAIDALVLRTYRDFGACGGVP